MARNHTRCLNLFYEASLDPAEWSSAVNEVSRTINAPIASMGILSMHQPEVSFLSAPNCPEAIEEYVKQFIPLDIWLEKINSQPVGKAVNGWELVTPRQLRNSQFYNEFGKSIGAYHLCTTILKRNSSVTSYFSLYRSKNDNEFDKEELRLFSLLTPHLQQAVEINLRLGSLLSSGSALQQVMDSLPYGIVLLNRNRKIIFANRKAESIFDNQDGLTIYRGQLHVATPRYRKKIESLIHECFNTKLNLDAGSGGNITLPRPSGKKPYELCISPLPRGTHEKIELSMIEEPEVVIFLNDPEMTVLTPTCALMDLYQLTGAEARLAQSISQGESLREIAERTCVSIETVRTQLKQIFHKTDTHSQAELMRILLATQFKDYPAPE